MHWWLLMDLTPQCNRILEITKCLQCPLHQLEQRSGRVANPFVRVTGCAWRLELSSLATLSCSSAETDNATWAGGRSGGNGRGAGGALAAGLRDAARRHGGRLGAAPQGVLLLPAAPGAGKPRTWIIQTVIVGRTVVLLQHTFEQIYSPSTQLPTRSLTLTLQAHHWKETSASL